MALSDSEMMMIEATQEHADEQQQREAEHRLAHQQMIWLERRGIVVSALLSTPSYAVDCHGFVYTTCYMHETGQEYWADAEGALWQRRAWA